MGIPHGRPIINYEDIVNTVPEEYILEQCFNISKLPCKICSPFRDDKNPSLSIYKRNDRVKYTDFGTGEHGSLLKFLCRVWSMDATDVCVSLRDKFLKGKKVSFYKKLKKKVSSETKAKSYSKIACVFRKWEEYDEKYWNSYGITKEWAEFGGVHPISHKIIYHGDYRTVFKADKYAYCYVEHKDNSTQLKIYQPFNTSGYKWQGDIDKSVWSLWGKLPATGDQLFITSSLKDALNLWCNTGIPAVSLQGEGYMPKPHIMGQLKRRFKDIIVFYDNDFDNTKNPGKADSDKLCKEFGLKKIEIPEEYFSKDPSDLYKNLGKNNYLSIINKLLIDLK